MYKVYGDIQSGNCYKLKLLMSLLDIEHEWIVVDVLSGETQSDDFAKMNPNKKIPVLSLGKGKYLTESNAILNYLAEGTPYLPTDPYQRALVLQWMFFEQYSHEPFIATARFINKYLGLPKEREAEYQSKQQGGHKALSIMEQQLAQTDFLVGDSLTIADICLYGYTHVSHEGGFELDDYASIRSWLTAIKSQESYIGMNDL